MRLGEPILKHFRVILFSVIGKENNESSVSDDADEKSKPLGKWVGISLSDNRFYLSILLKQCCFNTVCMIGWF